VVQAVATDRLAAPVDDVAEPRLPFTVVGVGASAGGVAGTGGTVVGVMVAGVAAAGGAMVNVGSDDPPQAVIMAHSSTNPAPHFRVVMVMSCLLVGLSGMRAAGAGRHTSGLFRASARARKNSRNDPPHACYRKRAKPVTSETPASQSLRPPPSAAALRTSSGAWLRGVLDMFAAEGLDVPSLLRDCGFDATGLDRPDARFPADDISQLWQLAVARSGKATLGLSRELAARHGRECRSRLRRKPSPYNRSSRSRVRSFRTSPVLSVVAGSNRLDGSGNGA